MGFSIRSGMPVKCLAIGVLAISCLILPVGKAHGATYKNVIAISCLNPVHVADFKTCAGVYNLHHGQNGLFVVVSQTTAATAFVQSTGTWTLTCSPCLFGGGTLTPVNQDGSPMTTDAQLAALDQTLFAQMRAAGPITKPIKVPPSYGGSYINNDALAEDTSSAISYVLYTQLGVNPNSVPLGTVVTVVWSDGTTAQFVRISLTGSLQWGYKPGTAKDAQGQPINPNGTRTSNPNSGGTGSGSVEPTVTPSSGYNWELNLEGGANCTATVTLIFSDGSTLGGTTFGPCP